LKSGKCEDCPKFANADFTGKLCVANLCPKGQVNQADGSCAPCPDYTIQSHDYRKCVPKKCKATEIVTKKGTCDTCPDYTRRSGDGKRCIYIVCTDFELPTKAGACKKCGKKEMANKDRTQCVKMCKPAEYMNLQAKPTKACQPCLDSANKMVTDDGFGCPCKKDFVNTGAECKKCINGAKANAAGTACVMPAKAKCPDTKFVGKDGKCADCKKD